MAGEIGVLNSVDQYTVGGTVELVVLVRVADSQCFLEFPSWLL